jgi:hypothetical protein
MAERRSIVLFEGLPGSGKTTTSQELAAVYLRRGTPCVWVREEAKDHPLFGPAVRRLHRQTDYDEICLARWRGLVDSPDQPPLILDGCAMQSTVRFMFEQNWALDRIESYWQRFEQSTRGLRVALVYFTHPRPDAFIRDHTMHVRGNSWPKIARHVEQTPAGRGLVEAGYDAPVEFWVRYRQMCAALLARTSLPMLKLAASNGWRHLRVRCVSWLYGMQPASVT